MTLPVPASEPYVRAQIVDQALNMKALSNPLWRDPADE